MRNNILLIVAVLSMFVFGRQIAEPVAASSLKVVDHGTIKINDNNVKGTYTWKTYQKGTNYVAMIGYLYSSTTNRGVYMYYYLKKVSKTKIKMTGKEIFKDYNSGTRYSQSMGTHYDYTKKTAARYYWREFRPAILSQVHNL